MRSRLGLFLTFKTCLKKAFTRLSAEHQILNATALTDISWINLWAGCDISFLSLLFRKLPTITASKPEHIKDLVGIS